MQKNDDNTQIDNVLRNPKYDFSEWSDLQKEDPAAFEAKRKLWIKEFIESAPKKYQQRLNVLMFQIDAVRSNAKTPVESCKALSKMMVNSARDMRTQLDDLRHTIENKKAPKKKAVKEAKVLEFVR